MKHYAPSDFQWKDLDLYLGIKETGFSVEKTKTELMFRVKWPDGVLSEDYYNLPRAREHTRTLASRHMGERPDIGGLHSFK